MEGLSVKDVADYGFGLGSSLAEGEMLSLGDRLLEQAAIALSPDSTGNMTKMFFERLEQAVLPLASGRNVEGLQELF